MAVVLVIVVLFIHHFNGGAGQLGILVIHRLDYMMLGCGGNYRWF